MNIKKSDNHQDLEKLAKQAYDIARQAGNVIMHFYRQAEPIVAQLKPDDSPLTIADSASHEVIMKGLLAMTEAYPILSEEGRQIPFVERQQWEQYWCVDPLDGTKDFLKRNDEFTVNIALIKDHVPVIGVIYIPAANKGYIAWQGGGAYCVNEEKISAIHVTKPYSKPLRIAVSRYHGLETLQPWLSKLGETVLIHQGSALKFCTVASGEADLFLRLSPSSEWDNAAGQCLIEEAGGQVWSLDGQPLSYNRTGTLEQRPFIVVGDQHFEWQKYYSPRS